MKKYLTIGEFAKLKQITTETLRHYDRYGLLKPEWIDPDTKYRYYSIMQYERLATILELRQLGMDLEEIKGFLEERNPLSALEMLQERHDFLCREIRSMQSLETKIQAKIRHMEQYLQTRREFEVEWRWIPGRKCLIWNNQVKNEMEVNLGSAELERCIGKQPLIFGANRYGFELTVKELEQEEKNTRMMLFLEEEDSFEELGNVQLREIREGTYACTYFYGYGDHMYEPLAVICRNLKKQGFQPGETILCIAQLDLSVTGVEETVLYEAQLYMENMEK